MGGHLDVAPSLVSTSGNETLTIATPHYNTKQPHQARDAAMCTNENVPTALLFI